MKYELIKEYKRKASEGAVKKFPIGFMYDCGLGKANELKASGHIAQDAQPVKPKIRKPKDIGKWLADDLETDKNEQ